MTNLPVSNYVQEEAHGSHGGSEERSNVFELHPQAQAENSGANANENYAAISIVRGFVGDQGVKMADHTREEIDAKIAASEARTDTKIARLEGKLDLVLSKLDSVMGDNRVTRTNQWVIGFGLAALLITIAALLPVFFGIGVQIKDIVDHAVETHAPITKK
jgi:hypothetical protein